MSEIATGKLVIWMRLQAKRIKPDGNRTSIMLSAAADRLESQEQTIDELEDECGKLKMTINLLTARAEQAEKNLHDAIFGTNHACFYCTMENCDGCTNSTVKEHFKYRALKPNKYLTIQDDRGLPQDGEGK